MSDLTLETLVDCLTGLEALELQGTVLLREHRPTGAWFPSGLPRDQVQAAVEEIIAYTEACSATARLLANVPPIPLLTAPVAFGL